jgi:uncharacterized protein
LEAILPALAPRAAAWRALAGAFLAAATLARAEAPLPVAHVRIGAQALRVEIAATTEQRMKGLMFREKLAKDDGMLFIFDEPGYHAIWMRNTLIPLSVAFIDGEGRILNIADMEPQSDDQHLAAGPARYAIETNKGWFAAHRLKAGDKVTGLPKPPK